jgi:hypothetical protein
VLNKPGFITSPSSNLETGLEQCCCLSAIVFFHTSIVWLQDKKDDPHGPPTKFIDMLFSGVSLKKDLPIGTK